MRAVAIFGRGKGEKGKGEEGGMGEKRTVVSGCHGLLGPVTVLRRAFGDLPPKFGDRYDWTTGRPYDGHERRKYRVIPRAHPSRALLCGYFNIRQEKGTSIIWIQKGFTAGPPRNDSGGHFSVK